MSHIIFKKIILVISFVLLSLNFSMAQEKSLDDLVRDLKRGSNVEKLEASKLIVPYGIEGKDAERSLRKLVGGEKNPENAVIYLSALLAISDNHSRAYKAFTKNGKSQKGSKYEKSKKVREFFTALGGVSPVPDSLLPYINSLRKEKNISYVAVNDALAGLVNNNPEMLVSIVDLIGTDPVNAVRILRKVENGLELHFEIIKASLDKAPLDGMELLIKHNELDDQVVNFAVSKAVMPNKDGNSFLFANSRTSWNAALDILVLSEKTSDVAQQKLFELLNSQAFSDVQKSITKYSDISEELEKEKLHALFFQLENTKSKENQRTNPRYELCTHIARLNIDDPSNIAILLNVAKNADDATVRIGCTYALTAVSNPDQDLVKYLESSLDVDIDLVVAASENLLNSVNSIRNQMQTVQFQSSIAPDLKSLYAAYVLLHHFPDHIEANAYADGLYDANVKYIEYDRNSTFSRNGASAFPMAMSENGSFEAVFAETTPFEVLGLRNMADQVALSSHVEAGIMSTNSARSFNAAKFAVENQVPITDATKEKILEILRSEENKQQSVVFILALQYAVSDDATMAILDSISQEKYMVRKNAADKVLETYK